MNIGNIYSGSKHHPKVTSSLNYISDILEAIIYIFSYVSSMREEYTEKTD